MKYLSSLVDLPEEVLFLTGASDINDAGQVIVAAQVVPEPETSVMLLTGLGLMGWMARRKKMEADATASFILAA